MLRSSGGQAQYLFDNLKPQDGLSTREVRCVYQDEEGFVWMGTLNGLNRFDGSHFRVWNLFSPGFPSSLDETVTCITEYGNGNIWFGTANGAAVFDKNNNRFRQVIIHNAHNKPIEYIAITQFQKDKAGRLWMATNKGVYLEKNGYFIPASSVFPYTKGLDNLNCIHAGFVYDSVRNVLWIASATGLYELDFNKQQLYSFGNNPFHLPVFTDRVVNAIAPDKKGNIWFGDSRNNALCYFDFGNNDLQTITHINHDAAWGFPGGCNALFYDSQDRLWIATWLYTSFVRSADGRFEKISYNKDLPYSIGYGLFNDAMQDKYGNIWLATINGVSRFAAAGFVKDIIKAPSFPTYIPVDFANINSLLNDHKGHWWLGKMDGLFRYDTTTRQFERFAPGGKELPWNEVFDVKMIGGALWCGTGNGIQVFDTNTKRFHPFSFYPANKDPKQNRVNRVFEDSKGYIWFSVIKDAVYRYDRTNHSCIRFDGSDSQWADMSMANILFILETHDATLWIGGGEKGIRIFNLNTQRFTKPKQELLNTDYVYAVLEDRRHHIWVSTKKHGLLKLDAEGRLLDSITSKDGLTGAVFYNIALDAQNKLWATSPEEMVCIDIATKRVTRVKLNVTFSFNDHWSGLWIEDNRLFATMLDNLVVIDTRKMRQSSSLPPPLISTFKVFQEDMPFNRSAPVELNYRQNFFSIDFSSPVHREISSIQYAYKLEGFDKDWVYCGQKQTASFTNVPNGKYTFLVKNTDAGNQWTATAASMTIIIQPPFWKTAWFILLMALLAAGCVWWLYRNRQKKIQQARIEKTIDYFANSVYGENSVHEICWDIARNCISQLQFEDCVVYLLDEQTNRLVQKAAYGTQNPKDHDIINPIEVEPGKGIAGAVAASGKPMLINDTGKDERFIADNKQRFSAMAVPVLSNSKVIGVIDCGHPDKNFFTAEHAKAVSTIASISANKIAEALAEAQAKENEIKLLEINKMLAESQLMALRAQMNPHFVFNCLNSIQECIVTQKYGEASKYLNKFSKLFRMVLNNSGKKLVTIDEEKEVLDLYLELEQMRFEKSFAYSITVDEELDTEDILIPSMLLQPYVENALWHGLMHKEDQRNLVIAFERMNEDAFRCTIEDNGIGRKRSYELKALQSKAKRHESKGLKISEDRILILKKQGYAASLHITDNYDEQQNATGTSVVIELSTFLKS